VLSKLDSGTIHHVTGAVNPPREERAIRLSELSRASAVPVPTIKYYLRERLLPPGRATAANQAEYDDLHVRRLRLIRALRDVGGVPIAAIREVADALDDPARSLHEVLGIAQRAVTPPTPDDEPPELAEVDVLLTRLGWEVSRDAPARGALAHALGSLRSLGRDVDAGGEPLRVPPRPSARGAGHHLMLVEHARGRRHGSGPVGGHQPDPGAPVEQVVDVQRPLVLARRRPAPRAGATSPAAPARRARAASRARASTSTPRCRSAHEPGVGGQRRQVAAGRRAHQRLLRVAQGPAGRSVPATTRSTTSSAMRR
jgi:DNA-binding transcriptional MerR regulator